MECFLVSRFPLLSCDVEDVDQPCFFERKFVLTMSEGRWYTQSCPHGAGSVSRSGGRKKVLDVG